MKKVLIVLAIMFPGAARADAIADEIMGRYNASLGKAKSFCTGLAEKINSVKTMAGVGIASGAVGTLAGGAGVVTGVMKDENDKKIAKKTGDAVGGKVNEALYKEWKANNNARKWNDQEMKDIAFTMLQELNKKSQTLGNIRTGTSFAAGATGAVGGAVSFAGMATLDKLIEDMNACDSYVREIESQKNELQFAAPGDSAIAQMGKIADACKGMSSKNIVDVKSKLKAAGIISVVGGAAGITGGVTSMIANSKPAGDGMNNVATVSAGVAAAGNLGGAILSGVVLSGLMKNGEIAEKCKNAF